MKNYNRHELSMAKQSNFPSLVSQLRVAMEQGFTENFKILQDGQLLNLETNRIYTNDIYAVIEVSCNAGKLYKITLHNGIKGTAIVWNS